MSVTRRNFMKTLTVGAAAISLPDIVKAATLSTAGVGKKITLKKGDTILFQGDSITDAGRKRDQTGANEPDALGGGYSFLATAHLLHKYAANDLKIYNRGVSGDKVFQLRDRWEEECIALKPDVLSVLVGVNDFWHTLIHDYKGTAQTYEDDFTSLLEYTKQKLPNVKLIIGEPFNVVGIGAADESWVRPFSEYRAAAKRVADAFGAIFIPYQQIFNEAAKVAPGKYWTNDGVHPTLAGAQLMTEAWLQAIEK